VARRTDFGALNLTIWVPLERQEEAEKFVAEANKGIPG
jgi:hypothetical protein